MIMEDKKQIKILFRDLKSEMKVLDQDGDVGKVKDCTDSHNVIVNFGRSGQGIYCLHETEEHETESLYYHNHIEAFDLFRNEVVCRRDSNQHHAKQIWDNMKHILPNDVQSGFKTEWNHYKMGEFAIDMFISDIEKIKKYFQC